MPNDCNGISGSCAGSAGPNFGLDANGEKPSNTTPNGCVTPVAGQPPTLPTPTDFRCKSFQIESNRSNEFIDNVVNESLNIGGTTLNVYKLLGVHEQSRLIDCTGRGVSISNGDLPTFPASNAFDQFISEWRSIQRGPGVLASGFIGYDFGNIKTNDDSRAAYGIETSIFKHITTISIKQSSNTTRRITRARIERSEDGKKWYGVQVVLLPDDDCLNTISIKDSVPSRYWRIRPLDFNGVDSNDNWGVVALQLFHNSTATDEFNIQDKVFLENRDKSYSQDVIPIKGYYDLTEAIIDSSVFGVEMPASILYFTVSFSGVVAAMGRPFIIGDIFELPAEAQFSAKLERIAKWLEVTDVSWATDGYTPGWRPTLLRIIAQPAFASQETQDIFGDLAETAPDALGTVEGEDGNNTIYQDYFDVSQTIEAEARDAVPERGADGSNTIRQWEAEEIESAENQGLNNLQKIGLNPTGLYVEDAMPPNNQPFTEDTTFPPNPNNGDYHRMVYTGSASDVPARLWRYSDAKSRWVFLEMDLRAKYNPTKATLEEFITSPTAVKNSEITRNRETLDENCE